MSGFIFICGALVLLSGAFYLFPRRGLSDVDKDQARANLEWYRLREAELAREGGEALREDARLRLLEDDQQMQGATQAAATNGPTEGFPVWILLPLVAISAAAIYYLLGNGGY